MPLRLHQREALDAWRRNISAGVSRGWIVLPPGAGKTMVGVRAIRESGRTGVVFSPNIAIQGQWQVAAPEVRCLTYQALANFGDDLGGSTQLARLHPNGRALVAELAATENLMIVLDECHHLLRTWGRLLAEVLGLLSDAVVLGLTATPATALTGAEATLENELFGEITYSATIPQVVAAGDLVPYQELGWLTNPTAAERDWLGEQQGRVQELLTHLSVPDRASVSLFEAVANLQANVSWEDLAATDERLTDALLRLAHAGYAEPPIGVALGECHRRDPGIEDWVAVLNQWLLPLADSSDPRDRALILEVQEVLPSIGYRWTRRGISAATSTMDRVLARSASKALAAVEIASLEEENLGADLRALVVCDFERAAALPHGLCDVVTADSGSAWQTLKALAENPVGQRLEPLLVTAGVVAGTPSSSRALMDFAAGRLPGHSLDTAEEEGLVRVLGWNVRQWVPVVTDFFQMGGTRLLVGTRGLLGEGWDAPGVNCLVDLTSATTPGAVVQLRGRSLRRDPENPAKVAINWSVACVADGVMGDADWRRLVRKHRGYLAPDEQGDLVDGVAHLADGFSEFGLRNRTGSRPANVLAARLPGTRPGYGAMERPADQDRPGGVGGAGEFQGEGTVDRKRLRGGGAPEAGARAVALGAGRGPGAGGAGAVLVGGRRTGVDGSGSADPGDPGGTQAHRAGGERRCWQGGQGGCRCPPGARAGQCGSRGGRGGDQRTGTALPAVRGARGGIGRVCGGAGRSVATRFPTPIPDLPPHRRPAPAPGRVETRPDRAGNRSGNLASGPERARLQQGPGRRLSARLAAMGGGGGGPVRPQPRG